MPHDIDYDFCGYFGGEEDWYEAWFIQLHDIDEIFEFAKKTKTNKNYKQIEEKLLKLKDAKITMRFLETFKGFNIRKHLEYLIDAEDFQICLFLFKNHNNELNSEQKEMLKFSLLSLARTSKDFEEIEKLKAQKTCSYDCEMER